MNLGNRNLVNFLLELTVHMSEMLECMAHCPIAEVGQVSRCVEERFEIESKFTLREHPPSNTSAVCEKVS